MISARALWCAGVAALAAAAGWLFLGTGLRRPPDILLVAWSACRADRLSAYGYRVDTTPWLRSFAGGAVTYREAFTPAPWTEPALASLFTGVLPERHGVRQGAGERVAEGTTLLAQSLQAAGYETVAFGLDAVASPRSGMRAGFDVVVPVGADDGPGPRADSVLEAVEAWMRERRNAADANGKPRFVFVAFSDLHLPRRPPPGDLAEIAGATPLPREIEAALRVDARDAVGHLLDVRRIDPATVAAMGTVYDASVRSLDRATGRLVDLLRKDALRDDACIAIVGDHGEHLGEQGRLGHEMSLLEGVLRIPMVVRWPGRLDGGRSESAQVRLQDLHATLLEAAGVRARPEDRSDATSLAETPLRPRLLRAAFHRPTAYLDEAKRAFPDAPPEAFLPFQVSIFGVREPAGDRGPLKYIRYEDVPMDDGPAASQEVLFDLGADPDEREDLVERGRKGDLAEAERLRRLLID